MRLLTRFFLTLSLFFVILPLQADPAFIKRHDVQEFIKDMVENQGFDKTQLTQTLNQVVIQPQVLEFISKPYEKKNWDTYRDLLLTANRVQEGLKFWQENQQALEKAEKTFGVPADIIVAILGVETQYGKYPGKFRVLDALSTLGFNYPPRAPFFKKELKEFLLLCKEHQVSPTQYYGSYAGAIGKPQFMPSSYRFYAVDFTGNGKKDLINDNTDTIGSVANYFHKHGWKMHESVAQPAAINGKRYRNFQTNPKFANYQTRELQAAGVNPARIASKQPGKAGLIELTTAEGKEYWMAYPNFFVITRYNTSPQYALVVYLLSEQLKAQKTQAKNNTNRAYA